MKKTILVVTAAALCLAGLSGQSLAQTDTIVVTVSLAEVVSVDVDPSTWNIGPIALGGGSYTSVTFAAMNDGNVREDFAIHASDGANSWFLGDPPGTDTFTVKETVSIITLTTSPQPLASLVPVAGIVNFQLQYDPPLADTQGGGVNHSFTVTITASQSP